MRIVVHGLPRPGLLLLLAVVAFGAMSRGRQTSRAEGVWASPGPVPHTASVPLITPSGWDPFERGKEIPFSLSEAQTVRVSVWDATGGLVRDWSPTMYPIGNFATYWDGCRWDGREAAAGVYVVRYDFGGVWSARRLLFLAGMP